MKRMVCGIFLFGLLFGIASDAFGMAPSPRPSTPMALIAPARMRALQVMFDTQHLRPAILFSYNFDGKTGRAHFYHWSGGAWRLLASDEFLALLAALPADTSVALIGGADVLPAKSAAEIMAAAPNIKHMPTMAPAELFNGLDEICRFQAWEWRWITERYGLQLMDVNESRRAYNPYAVRRSELPLTTDEFPVTGDDLPPVPMEMPE